MLKKPERSNMKFETYDRKFVICFTERSTFLEFNKFVHKYKDYRLQLLHEKFKINNQKALFFNQLIAKF